MLGHPLAKEVDSGQFRGERRDVYSPKLAKQRGVVLAAKPPKAIIGANEEGACTAGRVEDSGVDRLNAKAENQVAEILRREILSEPVPLFRRNELLKNGADNILGNVGEIAGAKIVDQRSKLARGVGRPLDPIRQVLGKDRVVVDFQGAGKSRASVGRTRAVSTSRRSRSGKCRADRRRL